MFVTIGAEMIGSRRLCGAVAGVMLAVGVAWGEGIAPCSPTSGQSCLSSILILDDGASQGADSSGEGGVAGTPSILCPPGSTDENEPECGIDAAGPNDFTNGGCNSTPPVFTPIELCESVCGTAGQTVTTGSTFRDTDWYRFVLTETTTVRWTVTADFGFAIFLVAPTCPSAGIVAGALGNPFEEVSISATLPPGEWVAFVAPDFNAPISCGAGYVGRLEQEGGCRALDTDLTLLPMDMDLRQDTEGPVTTKAKFDIWNANEVRFSGTHRCITCWDQTMLGYYDAPNHFLVENLHTDIGKARIDGIQSAVCEQVSQTSPLLGVAAREVTFSAATRVRSAVIPLGMGMESAVIRYDIIDGPEQLVEPGYAMGGSQELQSNIVEAIEESSTATASDLHRGSISKKGSVLVFPKVEIKWQPVLEIANGDPTAGLYRVVQDTFLSISNDFPEDVRVQMYFVNGDPPTDAVMAGDPPMLLERAHPGWNNVDVEIELTANEPTYWSVLSGAPKGVSPFVSLDLGDPPGRPDTTSGRRGGRVLRGYVVVWAVDADGAEISWNHLSGDATVVHYGDGTAWEYGAWAFQCVTGAEPGQACGSTPGELNLDGVEYDTCPSKLLLNFFSTGTEVLQKDLPVR